MTSAYEIINNTPLTDKMREQVKHYRYKYSGYSRLKEIETEIMFNAAFSYEENVRVLFEVVAFLFSIEQAEDVVENICNNQEHYKICLEKIGGVNGNKKNISQSTEI